MTQTPQPIGQSKRGRKKDVNPYTDKTKARRVALYMRVSTEEQGQSHSFSAQERKCREFLEQEKPHWVLQGVYKDEHSGKTTKRPQFTKILNLIEDGQIDAVVCHHLDRFSRNVHDILKLFKQFEEKDVVMAFAEDRFDFSTEEGRLHFHILAVFADWYLQNLSRETRKGKESRVLKGDHNNQLPFGYVRDDKRQAILVEKDAAAVKEAYEKYATGSYTDQQIATWLNQQGFRTRKERLWTKDGVRDMLQNEFYTGKVVYYRDLYPGRHPATVSEELYQLAQTAREKHRRAPRTHSPMFPGAGAYLLNGLVRCAACGRSLRAQGGSTKPPEHRYYREVTHLRGYDDCPHARQAIRMGLAHDQIGRIFQAFNLSLNWQAELTAELERDDPREKVVMERQRLTEQLRRLGEVYETGVYDRATFEAKKYQLQQALQKLTMPDQPYVLQAGRQVATLQTIWEAATDVERREFCQLMLENVSINMELKQIARVTPRAEFEWFFRHNRLLQPIETGDHVGEFNVVAGAFGV